MGFFSDEFLKLGWAENFDVAQAEEPVGEGVEVADLEVDDVIDHSLAGVDGVLGEPAGEVVVDLALDWDGVSWGDVPFVEFGRFGAVGVRDAEVLVENFE